MKRAFYVRFNFLMPAALDKFVKDRLSDPQFYPEKSPEDRESLAWAIANKLNNDDKLEAFRNWLYAALTGKEPESEKLSFVQVNTPTEISIPASGEGDLLVFKNAILCRAETNKNNDEVLPEGIDELAASIGGRAIDIEHNRKQNCGVFTAGRRTHDNALAVDGFIWADRWPEESAGVQNGTLGLSIEARASRAKCSSCQKEFAGSHEYCDHLKSRKSSGAKRTMLGLKASGGAVTRNPAASNADFRQASLYFVANHAEGDPDYSENSKEETMLNCPYCGKETTEDKCLTCDKSMTAKDLAASLAETIQALTNANQIKANAENSLSEAVLENTKSKYDLEASNTKVSQLEGALSDARTSLRRSAVLDTFTDEEWAGKKEAIMSMTDEAFGIFTASLKKSGSVVSGAAGVRLPEPVAGGTQKEPITLK